MLKIILYQLGKTFLLGISECLRDGISWIFYKTVIIDDGARGLREICHDSAIWTINSRNSTLLIFVLLVKYIKLYH